MKWISVKDQPLILDSQVPIMVTDGVDIAIKTISCEIILTNGMIIAKSLMGRVTHWTPLPDLPKDEE